MPPSKKSAQPSAGQSSAAPPAGAKGRAAHPPPHREKAGARPSVGVAGKKAAPAASGAPTAVSAPARRKWPKGGPSRADVRRYRQRLLDMLKTLVSSTTELAAEALQGSGGDLSVDHMADHGSDNFEQDFNLKLLEGEAEQLNDIRDALAKIDGRHDLPFGLCEACADGEQRLCETCPWIPASRLDVVPQARLCVHTKELEEQSS